MTKQKRKHEHDPKKLGDVGPPPPATPGEDVNVRAIVRFGVGLVVATTLVSALVFVFVKGLSRYETKRDPGSPPMGVPRREPVDPDNLGNRAVLPDGGLRLQRKPFQDFEQENEAEKKLLASYAWLDEKAGVVRLPIDRAMRLIVSRGLPVRVPGETTAPAATPRPAAAAPRPMASTRPSARPKGATPKKTTAPPPPVASEKVAEEGTAEPAPAAPQGQP